MLVLHQIVTLFGSLRPGCLVALLRVLALQALGLLPCAEFWGVAPIH